MCSRSKIIQLLCGFFLFLGDSFVVFTISRHGTTTIPLGYSVVAALFVYSVLLSDGARFQNLLPTL